MHTPSNRAAPILLGLWALAAIVGVGLGVLNHLPFPPPLFVFLCVGASVALIVARPDIRHWVMELPLPQIVGFHLVRFVGFYFLWLASHGRLPDSFATPAGVGDIITAFGAVLLLVTGNAKPGKALLLWNIFGSIDILFVVANAIRVVVTDPVGFLEFYRLPLGLLPTFVVPVIIVSHGVVFRRIRSPLPLTPSP
jgi:hypothetical protein